MKKFNLFFLLVLVIVSCQKDELNTEKEGAINFSDFTFNGNYFEFDNEDEFFSLVKKLQDISDEDLESFEDYFEFKSLQGIYNNTLIEYAAVEDEEGYETFLESTRGKVTLVKEDDLIDIEPLLVNFPRYIRYIVGSSHLLQIGSEIYQFSENFQYIYPSANLENASIAITNNMEDDFSRYGIRVYNIESIVQERFTQQCKSDQKPKWYCQKVRVRGRMGSGAFIVGGSLLDAQWDFETKSFKYQAPFYLPAQANNRVSASFTTSITTEIDGGNFSVTVPLSVNQDSYKVEESVALGFFNLGPNQTFTITDSGTSTHRLTRFVGNCSWDITCGLSF